MNLSGLSAVGPGFQQGQMNMAELQAKAQQIQQMQMQIDAQKRELAGQAALFQGMPAQAQPPGNAAPPQQNPQMGQPQPPMPGQPSQPMAPPSQQPPMPPRPMPMPAGQSQQMAPSGPQMAPQGGQPQGEPQQPGQDAGAVGQDLSPQAQMGLITQIAQSIKQRSPGIDPATLFEAVKQQISLMGALSQTQKQQLVLATDQIKSQVQMRGQDVSAANTQARVGAQERGQDVSRANTKDRIAAQIQTTNARIADADQRLNATQQYINARQDKSLVGRAGAKAQTERLGLLRTQLAQAKQGLSQAVAGGDAAKIAAAQQSVDQAYGRITDFQTKVIGSGTAAPSAGGKRYNVGDVITQGGKQYRVTGGDPSDPDVVPVP